MASREADGVGETHTDKTQKKRRHVFADGPAVVDGDRTRTWAELYDRCARLGDALRKQGCGRGDVVQCMLDNTAEMVEAQQGVAMSGRALGSVNTRLDAATVAYVLEHSDARLFIADERYEATCREALATLENPPPLVVVGGRADGYEALVESGDAAAPWTPARGRVGRARAQLHVGDCVEIKFTLHAIDATPARWRGDVGSSPLDGASAATSSPKCTRYTG